METEMALKKAIVEPSWEAKYSFSPAVITEGGKTIWLAGHVGFVDDAGASLAGNFDAQARQAFKNLEKTLRSALPALHGHSQGYLRSRPAHCSQQLPLRFPRSWSRSQRSRSSLHSDPYARRSEGPELRRSG